MNNINPLTDRKYRIPRLWSNQELRKFAPLFNGSVINISGWNDTDKEGSTYKKYFSNASEYHISNYKSDSKGLVGMPNEFFLDLEADLDRSLENKFDVVFNHTTLEHIYEARKAFKNLCLMTKDIAIIVVPFLQQMHATYGDYWRFTPLTVKRLFEENNFSLLYISFNNNRKASVYIFAIASKHPDKWHDKVHNDFNFSNPKDPLDPFENYIGCNAINNSFLFKLRCLFSKTFK